MSDNTPVAGDRHPDVVPRRETDLSIEVVLLVVLALYMVLFGGLLPGISVGALAYNQDSAYGLFLILVSLQAVTMGKTPIGDVPRNWAVILGGILAAAFGMLVCFIPGLVSGAARVVTGLVLAAGGFTLLIRALAPDRARSWLKMPGPPRQIALSALAVYLLLVPLGVVTLVPGIFSERVSAVLLLICGVSLGLLARGLHQLDREYPDRSEPRSRARDRTEPLPRLLRKPELPVSLATLLVTGTLLTLLAVLLVPVNLGLLPFSPDGQLGVLVVVNAIQIMALGETPLGQYRRTSLLVLGGVAFAVFGIVACIVPGLVTNGLQWVLGSLTLAGGGLGLARTLGSLRRRPSEDGTAPQDLPPALVRIGVIQLVLNVTGLVFGLSMLLPGLLPGLVVAAILASNGLLVFLLATTLMRVPQTGA